jgi:hypothetical protein
LRRPFETLRVSIVALGSLTLALKTFLVAARRSLSFIAGADFAATSTAASAAS